MALLVDVGDPYKKEEILAALDKTHEQVGRFYAALPVDVFFARPEKGWSPAENVKHLTLATWAVALGMIFPRFMYRLLFGRPRVPSRRLKDVQGKYLGALRAGGKAGIYTPPKEGAPESAAEERRARLMRRFDSAADSLRRRVDHSWTEKDLEELRLPHPIMGRITAREMLLFTILHCLHHTGIVANRLGI